MCLMLMGVVLCPGEEPGFGRLYIGKWGACIFLFFEKRNNIFYYYLMMLFLRFGVVSEEFDWAEGAAQAL